MPSNFNRINSAFYEPEAKIFTIYSKTTAGFVEFQFMPQMHHDQVLETWARVIPAPLISSGNVLVYTSTAEGVNAACAVPTWKEIKPAGVLTPAAFVGRVGHGTVLKWDMNCLVHLDLSWG